MRLPCLVLLATLVICAARPAAAATGISLLPAQGTPDTVVAVTGSGFAASEAVDVYVDLTDTVLLVSSSSGSISGSGGVVYFTSQNNTLYVVDATYGTILTTFVTGASFFGGPAVSDGVAYLSPLGGSTYAFSLNANTDPMVRRAPPSASSLHPDLRLEMTQ